MPIPRFFWFSASVALLLVAFSTAYFFLAVMPAAERQRDEQAAEIAKKQTDERRAADCVEQARKAGEDMGKTLGAFGVRETVTGVSNHYNHKLGKCIVDVQTVDKNGTGEYVMDAYEQSSILWCSNRLAPKIQRVCMNAHNSQIDPTEADKQVDALLRE